MDDGNIGPTTPVAEQLFQGRRSSGEVTSPAGPRRAALSVSLEVLTGRRRSSSIHISLDWTLLRRHIEKFQT